MGVFTVYDVADALKVSYETALNYIKYSGVPYFKVGRTYRVNSSDLKVFIDKEKKKLK